MNHSTSFNWNRHFDQGRNEEGQGGSTSPGTESIWGTETLRWRRKVPKMSQVLWQPLRWRCVKCVIHKERDVREEQQYIYVARTSNNRVIAVHDLCWCLLPQCEALRTCRSGYPIATVLSSIQWICFRKNSGSNMRAPNLLLAPGAILPR